MGRENIFRFKQFAVLNDRTPMKVGTDGVLLGAWCPVEAARQVLDVGTGCGVIALMIAQRAEFAHIDGIDIEHDAIVEASVNFSRSPWSKRLTAREVDFNSIVGQESYDLIVSNPPYFSDSLLPRDESRSMARHGLTLSYSQLVEGASHMLTPEGSLALISPTSAEASIIEAATFASLPVRHMTRVIPVKGGAPKRTLWRLTRRTLPCIEDTITIAHTDGSFTHEYTALTRPFYLKM